MKRLVLKDFLALKEGDIISFSIGSSNTIYAGYYLDTLKIKIKWQKN